LVFAGPSVSQNRYKIIKFNASGVVDLNYPIFGNPSTVVTVGPYRAALDLQGNLFVAGDIVVSAASEGVITKLLPSGEIDPNWSRRFLGFSPTGTIADMSNGFADQLLVQGNRLVVSGSFDYASTLFRPNLVAFPTGVFPTTTTIVSDAPNPSAVNQGYTVVVSVTSPNGIPDGTVGISDGTGASCDVALLSGGGNCVITSTTSGQKTLRASYRTTTVFAGSSTSTLHNVTVPAPTTTVITSDAPDPSAISQAYVVAVSVTSAAGTPSGAVTVTDGTGARCIAALSNGLGSCSLTSTSGGAKTLVANYPESAQFGASSGTDSHLVNGPGLGTPVLSLVSPFVCSNGRFKAKIGYTVTGAEHCEFTNGLGTTWGPSRSQCTNNACSNSQRPISLVNTTFSNPFSIRCFSGAASQSADLILPTALPFCVSVPGNFVTGGVSSSTSAAGNLQLTAAITNPSNSPLEATVLQHPNDGFVLASMQGNNLHIEFIPAPQGLTEPRQTLQQTVRILIDGNGGATEFTYTFSSNTILSTGFE
jgi:hypothetical protein